MPAAPAARSIWADPTGFCRLFWLAKTLLSEDMVRGPVVSCVGDLSMTEHRSFYLDSEQNDFAEFSEIDHSDIPFVDPANDNERTKGPLSARNRALMRRLIANLRTL